MSSPIDIDALPLPGTQLFLPSLLSQLRSTAPGLPLEPVIIQILLLCIISGDRNLIIRTRDEDVNFVSKLTSLALSAVFGYNVHKLKCHPDTAKQTPSEFIRSLFFSVSTISLPADGLSGSSHKHRHRRMSSSRTNNSGSKPPVVPPTAISTARSRRTSFSRSISHPTESKPSIGTLRRSPIDSEEPAGIDVDPKSATETHSRRPSVQPIPTCLQTAPSVATLTASVKTHHGHSHGSAEPLKLPSAVVVSALEHASIPAQKAVLRTLSERKIIMSDGGIFGHDQEGLALELPDGFFMVYVCRSDPRERPAIYKSLLDRFAMSSAVNVSPQTRLAMRQYRPPSSPSTALSSPHTSAAFPTLHSLNSLPGPPTPPPPPLASPLIPSTLLCRLKQLCGTQTRIRPPLNIYIADLFSAARHYGPLDGMLLTTRARQDAEALVRATRVLGVDRTGAELIQERADRTSELDSTSTYPHSHPSIGSASSDALIETFDVVETYEPSMASSVYRSIVSQSQSEEPVELDVSEADIARIFPRVVSHRVRIRDSPVDEVLSSAICGATSTPGDERRGDSEAVEWERETVKDILVHILAEV